MNKVDVFNYKPLEWGSINEHNALEDGIRDVFFEAVNLGHCHAVKLLLSYGLRIDEEFHDQDSKTKSKVSKNSKKRTTLREDSSSSSSDSQDSSDSDSDQRDQDSSPSSSSESEEEDKEFSKMIAGMTKEEKAALKKAALKKVAKKK